MIEVLLFCILVTLVGQMFQAHRQHKELIEWLDAYAEMVGEAIDEMRNR
jgi:hypothetical protein